MEAREERTNRAGRSESGFTLIELLVVVAIIAILLAIALPSYLGLKDRSSDGAAQANVRSAISAVETYFADNGTYSGMSLLTLRSIDSGIKLNSIGTVTAATYCVDAMVNGKTWNKAGPAASLTRGPCS